MCIKTLKASNISRSRSAASLTPGHMLGWMDIDIRRVGVTILCTLIAFPLILQRQCSLVLILFISQPLFPALVDFVFCLPACCGRFYSHVSLS